MVEVIVNFGRADARVESEHVGAAHWVNLWTTQNGPTGGVRIFCVDYESAETLAAALVRCGARRVCRQVER